MSGNKIPKSLLIVLGCGGASLLVVGGIVALMMAQKPDIGRIVASATKEETSLGEDEKNPSETEGNGPSETDESDPSSGEGSDPSEADGNDPSDVGGNGPEGADGQETIETDGNDPSGTDLEDPFAFSGKHEKDKEDYYWYDPETGNHMVISDVKIIEEYFPDERFREIVAERFDLDHNCYLERGESFQVTKIRVSEEGIESLAGIEFFPMLRGLYCDRNELTELVITDANPRLETLCCQNNRLEKLEVSQAGELCVLYCEINELKELDLSFNYLLEDAICYGNDLDIVKVWGPDTCMYLSTDPGKIESTKGFRVNHAVRIDEESFPDPILRERLLMYDDETDIGYVTNTEDGYILADFLPSLDVSGCSLKDLEGLEIFSNIWQLDCCNNELTDPDLSIFPRLKILYCIGNPFEKLDVSNNPDLERIVLDEKVELIGAGANLEINPDVGSD